MRKFIDLDNYVWDWNYKQSLLDKFIGYRPRIKNPELDSILNKYKVISWQDTGSGMTRFEIDQTTLTQEGLPK